MNICRPATIVLGISILGIIFDIYLFGFYVIEFLKNIIFAALIVIITNWTCYKLGYSWIAWLIVIINLLLLLFQLYLIKNKNTGFGKTVIDEENKNRNKK
jgi:hypothetical protein